jgi:hypothetical protein
VQSFKLASEDWVDFVLGGSAPAGLAGVTTLDAEGPDIRINFPISGLYQFVMDAPDSAQAKLTITPIE